MSNFDFIETGGAPVKAWTRGVAVEPAARRQIENIAGMPFIHHHVAVMPDVHWGMGATVGSVIPTVGAIIPAAVGVDIGCGMAAVRTASSESGRSAAVRLVSDAHMPQPMSTPTAAGTIAPLVGITLPTVAPLPRCTSGMTATCL